MCIRCPPLQLNRQSSKEDDLHGRSGCVPEWTTHAVAIRHSRGLKKRCGPGPRRHYSAADQTGLDCPASRAEHFRRLQFVVVSSQNERRQHHPEAVVKVSGYLYEYQSIQSYAKRKPSPTTTPYPVALLRGGVVDILISGRAQRMGSDRYHRSGIEATDISWWKPLRYRRSWYTCCRVAHNAGLDRYN